MIRRFAGGDIEYVSSELTPGRIAYWAKLSKWTGEEAAALLCGIDPDVDPSMVVVGEAAGLAQAPEP